MSALQEIELSIENLLTTPPYALGPAEHELALIPVLRNEIAYACDTNPRFANYVRYWPIDFKSAQRIADFPYLPVAAFKSATPLSLIPKNDVKRTLTSSATTGQIPSRVVLDSGTSRRMSKGFVAIIREYIGTSRRPYLVVDTAEMVQSRAELGARGAAIQGLGSFATEIVSCLSADEKGEPAIDIPTIQDCAEKWRDREVLVYGFTFVLWTNLVQPLLARGVSLGLQRLHVLHSGGWKRLQDQAVTKNSFNEGVAKVFGCSPDRVIDYYGMVENVGVVYPDCEFANKHVPAFADVIIRDPLTLSPVEPGGRGYIQVSSVLPTSFPGFLILSEDLGELIGHDRCPCGRRGTHFRFVSRAPKAELRGCGNLPPARGRLGEVAIRA